jgi:hypothetical protein
MSTDLKQAHSYVDLGSTWLRDHTARIQQRHLQFGTHCELDVGSLLARAASLSRIEIQQEQPRENFMRRATIDAIEHCLWLDVMSSAAALEANLA